MLKIVFMEKIMGLFQPKSIATLAALVLLAVILVVVSRKTAYKTKTLAYGAIAISAAFILSYVKLLEMPTGGTITIASMLPIFVFAYIAGPRAGMLAGLAYGMLQFIQDPYMVHWAQVLLDYPIAFAVLGLSGAFRKNIILGTAAGGAARFVCHFLTGVIFFGSYAPEGQNVWVYSFIYNISYMLPDTLICMGLLLIPSFKRAISIVKREAAV